MVAKINRGVSLYGAVIYNQRKVDEATARSRATSPPTGTRRSRYCISP